MPEIRSGFGKLQARIPAIALGTATHHHPAGDLLARHFMNQDDFIAGQNACFQTQGTAVRADDYRPGFLGVLFILGALADDLDGNVDGQPRTPAHGFGISWRGPWRGIRRSRLLICQHQLVPVVPAFPRLP